MYIVSLRIFLSLTSLPSPTLSLSPTPSSSDVEHEVMEVQLRQKAVIEFVVKHKQCMGE